MCPKHYERWRKHGDPSVVKKPHHPRGPRPDQRGSGHPGWRGGRVYRGNGYVWVWVRDDDPYAPMGSKNGTVSRYVLEHRFVMAKHLGRLLLPGETVHHINGIKDDNRLENLQLRQGNHGKGAVARCRSCGSHDIHHLPLAPM